MIPTCFVGIKFPFTHPSKPVGQVAQAAYGAKGNEREEASSIDPYTSAEPNAHDCEDVLFEHAGGEVAAEPVEFGFAWWCW